MIADCSWDAPGSNRYTGTVAAAVAVYSDLSPELRERVKARKYDELVLITRDSITGNAEYLPSITMMHFGKGQVCGAVSRARWADNATERGLVFCEGAECVLVPTVCGNVSRITRVIRKPQEPPLVPDATLVPPESFEAMASLPEPLPGYSDEPGPAVVPLFADRPPIFVSVGGPVPVAPIPEPSTYVLMIVGLLGFLLLRKRQS